MIEENYEKTPVRLVGTGIWTRDLQNASLVRYHGATSLGSIISCSVILILWYMNLMNNGQMDRGNKNPTQHLP